MKDVNASMKQSVKNEFWSRYFKLRINKKTLAALLLYITAFFIWFFAFPQFGPILSEFFNRFQALGIDKGKWIMLFLASMTASAIGSGFLVDKTLKKVLIIIIITPIISVLTGTFLWLNFASSFLFAILLGLTAGISPVAIGAYFADHTSPEDRGRIVGIAIGATMLISQAFLLAGPLNIGSVTNTEVLIIGSVLLITFAGFAFRSKENPQDISASKTRKGPPPKQIALYAIPIFLFYMVAGILFSMVFPTIQDHINNSVFYLIWAIPFMLGAVFAGVQLDIRGRKFPTILGLAITGVSLAVFGIIGVNWGYLCIVPLAVGYSYVAITSLIVWADLAPAKSRGKYYGIGFGLITVAQMVGLILSGVSFGSASSAQISSYMLFASIALFLCIPPLFLADEALPKELIEKRQLIDYLDGVKEKFTKKKQA
jgi:MFS family permease